MHTKRYDITIIGGGVSGLSLAYLLAEMDRKVLVIDRLARASGAIESLSYDDFSIDLGAHTGYNSYTTLLDIVDRNPIKQELIKRSKQSYFFASNKGFQKLTKHLRLGELALNLPSLMTNKKDGKTVKEYYEKIVGKKNYQNFARHFFKAVLCQDAENYPAAFFLKRRKNRNTSFPKSFSFPKGMKTFTTALQAHPNITLQTNTQVESLTKTEAYSIKTNQGIFESESIAFANYAKEAALLLTEQHPDISEKLASLSYKTLSSLGIIVEKESTHKLREFAGLLTNTEQYTSIVSRDIVPHPKYRGFTIHAQGEVELEKLRELLCTTLQIEKSDILKEKYKNNKLPQLQKGHEDFLYDLTELIAKQETIYITGNYFHGLSLEDCLQRSQEEALRYISTQKSC